METPLELAERLLPAVRIYEAFAARGITLTAGGGRLVATPREGLTDLDRATVRPVRPELLMVAAAGAQGQAARLLAHSTWVLRRVDELVDVRSREYADLARVTALDALYVAALAAGKHCGPLWEALLEGQARTLRMAGRALSGRDPDSDDDYEEETP